MVWWYVAVFVASLVISYATGPKGENPRKVRAASVEAPTAQEGLPIPMLFGTRVNRQPNIVWFGDIRTSAIRKKGGKK